jgi:hypothetical protein
MLRRFPFRSCAPSGLEESGHPNPSMQVALHNTPSSVTGNGLGTHRVAFASACSKIKRKAKEFGLKPQS